MKILMVSGPVHYSYSLCRALGEAGAEVRFLAPTVFDVVQGYPTPFEVRRPFDGRGYWGGLRGILDEARAFRPDVVHFQWTFAPRKDWIAARWLPALGAPAVLTVHNVRPHEPAVGEVWALKRLYRRFAAFWAHAEPVREELATFGVSRERVAVIPHGNFTLFRERFGMPEPAIARERLGIPSGAPVLLFFGGLRGYKGLDVLLAAFAKVRERTPAAWLVIAGPAAPGDAGRVLQGTPPGREGQVLFRRGYVADEDIPGLFSAADVVVLPYVRGTYSGVMHLAYAFEKPVVTTRVGAVGATVEEDGTGLAVPPGDVAALAQACAALLSDPAARARHIERVRAVSREKYDWRLIAKRALGWYAASASYDLSGHLEES